MAKRSEFGKAYAAARKAKGSEGTFSYKGKKYSTKTKEESAPKSTSFKTSRELGAKRLASDKFTAPKTRTASNEPKPLKRPSPTGAFAPPLRGKKA